MGLFSFFSKSSEEQRLTEVAEDIANRSRDTVWQRVKERVPTLGVNETRGYIRARAASVIHSEVNRVIKANLGAKESQRGKLVEFTTNAVIRLIVAQLKLNRAQPAERRKVA